MRTIKDWTTVNIRERAKKRTGDSVGKDWRSFLQPAVFVIPVKGAGGDAGGASYDRFRLSPLAAQRNLIEGETPLLHTNWIEMKKRDVQCESSKEATAMASGLRQRGEQRRRSIEFIEDGASTRHDDAELAEAFTSLDSCKEGFSNVCSLDRRSSVIFTFIHFLISIFKTPTSSDQCSASRQQPQKMESSHLIQLRFLPNKGSPCFATPAVKKRRRKRQFHPSALSAGSRKGTNPDAPHQISKCHVHEVSR
ncbi:hypothetical protein BGZ57DRAFT_923445 [Hyaloscypha finlandica]|nr:hypothetical protein BGZ57DRAFT_923445 [Hyaloscypha finlandica]